MNYKTTYQLSAIGLHQDRETVPVHAHLQAEVILPFVGSCLVHCQGQPFHVVVGTCLYIPARLDHDQQDQYTDGFCRNYYLKIPELESVFGHDARLFDLRQDDLLLRWSQDLASCARESDDLLDPTMAALTRAWVERLAYLTDLTQQELDYDSTVQKAVAYIAAHYVEDLSLQDIADAASISVSHLGLLFRKTFGYSVMSHLSELRMRHARRLLLDDYRQIAEIGAQVGYLDANYFARQFKQQHGMSPRAWRKQQE